MSAFDFLLQVQTNFDIFLAISSMGSIYRRSGGYYLFDINGLQKMLLLVDLYTFLYKTYVYTHYHANVKSQHIYKYVNVYDLIGNAYIRQ